MAGGLGAFPIGGGPYGGVAPPAAAEARTVALSSRHIDTVRRDYTTDADGNPEGMDGTAARVYLLLSYADVRQAIITADGIAARQATIVAALAPLTAAPEPAVADLSVSVTDAGGDHVEGVVTYRNLLTNTLESVVIR